MNFTNKSLPFTILLIAIILPLTANLPVFGQSRQSVEEVTIEKKLIEGKKFTLLGDWDKAEAIFRAILAEDVQNSAACYELSRTLTASNKLSEALSYIQKAIRIEPDNEWYHLMEADIHEKSSDLYAAMEVYDRLIVLRPEKAHYYEMQINFCKKTGELEKLLVILEKYESLRGVNESITRLKFETLDELNRKDEALGAIHKLTVVYPDNTEYKFLAAAYAKKIGQEQKAQQYYNDVLAVDPGNSRAMLAMASVEKKEGDDVVYLQSITPVILNPEVEIDVKIQELLPFVIKLSKSKEETLGKALVDIIGQLVAAHPKEAKAFAMQGDVLSIMEQNTAAIDAYKKSTALNGGVYVVWEQMIALLLSVRSYDEVIVQANAAMDIFPNQAYLYYAAGYGMYKKKRLNDALEMLNEALLMTGKHAGQKISVYNILGLVYDELGDLEKSSLAFETALSIDPKNAETLSQYSLVLSRRIAQSEKALAMTAKVLEQGPQTPAIHETLAQVLYNQKRYKEAYESIQQVLNADPFPESYDLAGDILLKLGNTDEAVEMWQKALSSGSTSQEIKKKIAEHKTQ